MIVEMTTGASKELVDGVVQKARSLGLNVQLNLGTQKTVVALLGSNTGQLSTDIFAVKLASREYMSKQSLVSCSGVEVGGKRVVVMAGPCAVEGLELLAKARESFGLPVITEVVDPHDVSLVTGSADILQVGSRNMQNFALLTNIGRSQHPVVLKRGYSCTITEWLTAADYLLAEGNNNIILCERGIRTFEDSVRFSLDISSIPVIKRFSHLPVIVDPSHAAGHYSLVPAIAKAAVAAGADGLLIEVHPNPKEALVDGLQSLTLSDFARLMEELKPIAEAVGRYI
jgi:3-deoxy-7-phosphoheptulonate synthase